MIWRLLLLGCIIAGLTICICIIWNYLYRIEEIAAQKAWLEVYSEKDMEEGKRDCLGYVEGNGGERK